MTSRRGVLRCLIAAVLFGAAAPAASILAGEMPTLVLAGLLYLGAALAVLPAVIPAATGSLLLNFELVATLAIAAVVFREHLGRRLLVAAGLIGLAGILLVWQPGVAFDVGGLLIIGASVCWGGSTTASPPASTSSAPSRSPSPKALSPVPSTSSSV